MIEFVRDNDSGKSSQHWSPVLFGCSGMCQLISRGLFNRQLALVQIIQDVPSSWLVCQYLIELYAW